MEVLELNNMIIKGGSDIPETTTVKISSGTDRVIGGNVVYYHRESQMLGGDPYVENLDDESAIQYLMNKYNVKQAYNKGLGLLIKKLNINTKFGDPDAISKAIAKINERAITIDENFDLINNLKVEVFPIFVPITLDKISTTEQRLYNHMKQVEKYYNNIAKNLFMINRAINNQQF
jgi:hypothetical protein